MIENQYIYYDKCLPKDIETKLLTFRNSSGELMFQCGINGRLSCKDIISIYTNHELDLNHSKYINNILNTKNDKYYLIAFSTNWISPIWIFNNKEKRDNIYLKLTERIKFINILEE